MRDHPSFLDRSAVIKEKEKRQAKMWHGLSKTNYTRINGLGGA